MSEWIHIHKYFVVLYNATHQWITVHMANFILQYNSYEAFPFSSFQCPFNTCMVYELYHCVHILFCLGHIYVCLYCVLVHTIYYAINIYPTAQYSQCHTTCHSFL